MINFFSAAFHKVVTVALGSVIVVGGLFGASPQNAAVSAPTSSPVATTSAPSSTPQKELASPIVTQSLSASVAPIVKTKSTVISSPAIVSVNPNLTVQGFNNIIVISGNRFESGATIQIGDVSLQESRAVTPSAISFELPASFSAGNYSLTITNPDGGSFTLANAITVQPKTPSIPSSPTESQTVTPDQANEQAQSDATALQQKANQINAITASCTQQYNAMQQQIIDVKNQYYEQEADACGGGGLESLCEEKQINLLNAANMQIGKIQTQEQQLQLTCNEQVDAIEN